MNAQIIVASFTIALAIIGLGAAVVIGLRGTALKADLERVRQSNIDLDAEIKRKDRHTADQDEKIKDLQRDYQDLRASDARKGAALARIGEAAASGAELRELVAIIKEHDREAASRHTYTVGVLKEIRDAQSKRNESGKS